MTDVTRILLQIEQGDPRASDKLLPLVYEELRKLATAKLSHERPGQTLEATALVHEAYLRLVGGRPDQSWDSRGHFFAAAAEAMRRILVENARRKQTLKHGGAAARVELTAELAGRPAAADPGELLAVHELLDQLAAKHPRKAQVVKLRYFLGCSQKETAQILGITDDAAQDDWVFARAWLKREWRKGEPDEGS
jgi:RNA polymerase sigma factor (TIGR02999 family)